MFGFYERIFDFMEFSLDKNKFSLDKKEFFFDLKVFFFDLNVGMVATIRPLWYLPQGSYGTYHTSVMVGTIM
ncbi:MAG: hypothetical protein WC984_09215, partial [Bacteroidales bacterium]